MAEQTVDWREQLRVSMKKARQEQIKSMLRTGPAPRVFDSSGSAIPFIRKVLADVEQTVAAQR